jgi:hypothetical protein
MKIVGRFAFLQAALLLLTFVAVFAALAYSQPEVAPEHFDASAPREHEHSAKADGESRSPCQADGNGTSNNHEI